MSLRALAFGPLPKSQVQASQRLSLPSSSGSSFSGGGSGGGGQYDAGLTGGSPLREPEAFSPVFPDLFAQAQAGSAAAPDFNSETAQSLSGVGTKASESATGIDPSAFQSDFNKALQSVNQGLKLGKSGKALVDYLRDSGFPTGGDAVDFSAGAPGSQVSGGELSLGGDALGGTESATGGAAGGGGLSGLGGATAGGAGLAALLGILAQATGNADLGMAAKSAGIGTGLLGLANTGSSLAGLTGALGGAEAAGSAFGTAGAASAGAGVGAGVGVGAATAPIAAMLMAWSIANMLNPGSAPDLSDMWTGGKLDPYLTFNKGLMANESQQGRALSTLSQALPYAQSNEELGQLINQYKNYLGTTTGIALEDKSGTGDPYRLTTIPGTGSVTHGMPTPAQDWGPQTAALQSQIDALSGRLPGSRITGNAGLPADATMRLWTQFLDREKNAPTYVPNDVAPTPGQQVGEGVSSEIPGTAKGFYGSADLARLGGQDATKALQYGAPGYDYAGSGFPEPGQYVGSKSAAYQNMTLDQVLRSLMGGTSG